MPENTVAAAVAPFLAAINNFSEAAATMPPEVVLALTAGTPAALLQDRWERTVQEAPERIGDYVRSEVLKPDSVLNACALNDWSNKHTIDDIAAHPHGSAAIASIRFADDYLINTKPWEKIEDPTLEGYYMNDELLAAVGGSSYSYFYWLGSILRTVDAAAQNPKGVLAYSVAPIYDLPAWYARVAEAGVQIHHEVLLP